MKLIDKDAIVAEIDRLVNKLYYEPENFKDVGAKMALDSLKSFLDTLEVRDPYERCVQYQSVEAGIKAHAEIYSFNTDSALFPQLTEEQQKLWRKEIEYACISGGDMGYTLAKDPRYKENHEVKEVDLEKYINELSKQFPEVSFAKLSRIAVRVAKWQKQHLWKHADGDELPEIDREVIVLVQDHPDDKDHLRVVFAHRPSKYTKVWNSDLGEEQVIEIERHGKGGWNIPGVVSWLDLNIPNLEND